LLLSLALFTKKAKNQTAQYWTCFPHLSFFIRTAFLLGYLSYFRPDYFEVSLLIKTNTKTAKFSNYDDEKEIERLKQLFENEQIYTQSKHGTPLQGFFMSYIFLPTARFYEAMKPNVLQMLFQNRLFLACKMFDNLLIFNNFFFQNLYFGLLKPLLRRTVGRENTQKSKSPVRANPKQNGTPLQGFFYVLYFSTNGTLL
jgi:hypothetical protein